MLLRFRVANHRSIRDECELSLIGAGLKEGASRDTGIEYDHRPVPGLSVLGVFGANASGKTNLLSAMTAMRDAVRTSFADWPKSPGVPRQPFKLDRESADETTLFEVDLVLGHHRKIRYTYGFELSDERVEAEWLHAYPDGERQVWFDREAGRPEAEGPEFLFEGSGFTGNRRDDLVAYTRSDALFLSTGATLNDPVLSALHRWFLDNLWLVTPGEDITGRTTFTQRMLTEKNAKNTERAYRERILQLLAIADLGITGIDVDPESGGIRLRHRTPDGGDVPLEFLREESFGTHAWFAFLGPMLTVLDNGTTLLVDELDSSLHPTLAAEVVRIFQDPKANPNNAQLVFTTHDATLLGSAVLDRPLDREQVWIAAKERSGATSVYPVTAAHPAEDEDLESGYLRGRYGGVPRVGAGAIARELSWQEAKETA
ncbi:ATP-binding protein [Streptomyces sp. ME18-1-4]|uniref:AAA family ATPase n=1 Tax=Streptomyces sp. ME18-1-4 TaxID=3028685 RepID=UPI0029B131FE|nr:ATP-binding protein [Streptomyces sp. ME18-1-4]MDX3243126.1 ATP-binding protein [Streptomyces sp. ME18-1-4]